MEQLIKKVEDLRMHIRNRNIVSAILSFLIILNSFFVVFGTNYPTGARFFHVYMILLILFIDYYIYKNRTNLPLPKEVTKESMEAYQIKQLKRYLWSNRSLVWWGFMPLSMVMGGFAFVQIAFLIASILKVIGMVALLAILYYSNKYWTNRYNEQYIELTGEELEIWFEL